jgi:hypothetical protein
MNQKLHDMRDALQQAIDIEEENARLKQTVVEQSLIIAGLVLQSPGGVGLISARHWEKVHERNDFVPYCRTAVDAGVEIRISLPDAEKRKP